MIFTISWRSPRTPRGRSGKSSPSAPPYPRNTRCNTCSSRLEHSYRQGSHTSSCSHSCCPLSYRPQWFLDCFTSKPVLRSRFILRCCVLRHTRRSGHRFSRLSGRYGPQRSDCRSRQNPHLRAKEMKVSEGDVIQELPGGKVDPRSRGVHAVEAGRPGKSHSPYRADIWTAADGH